jgi:TolB-like protein
MSLIAELKRRKVFKVGAAYLVVAWLAVQAVSIGFPAFDTPPWVLRVFILVAMLGFPIALVFAWVFDRTPDGVKVEVRTRASIGVYLGAAALVALTLGWYFKGQPSYRAGDIPASSGPSVAVLPFANMSGKADEEYFSDGMTEELLNVLAKIPKLNVAARTSVFEFKGKGGDVREIGRKLGVTHIVEGSVRREGGQVRITAQLIRVVDGFHVWSDSYDRELRACSRCRTTLPGTSASSCSRSSASANCPPHASRSIRPLTTSTSRAERSTESARICPRLSRTSSTRSNCRRSSGLDGRHLHSRTKSSTGSRPSGARGLAIRADDCRNRITPQSGLAMTLHARANVARAGSLRGRRAHLSRGNQNRCRVPACAKTMPTAGRCGYPEEAEKKPGSCSRSTRG